MESYREEHKEARRETGRWVIYLLGLIVIAALVTGLLSVAGVIGSTVVEREVFENSYQRTAAEKQKIATYEAQLAEVRRQLMDPNLNETTRNQLEAQKAALSVQLSAARARQ